MTPRGLALLIALGVIWGIPYLLIKIAVTELSPAALVLARTVIASLILVPLAAARGELRAVWKRRRPLLAFALIEIAIPWYLLSSAEQRLPSSTTGLLIAAVPLVGLATAYLGGRAERFVPSNWLGIGLGMAGVATILGLDLGTPDLAGLLELTGVIVCYALGPQIVARWMSDLSGVGVSALAFALAAVLYVPVVLLSGGLPSAWPSEPVLASAAVLGVVCSATAFIVFMALIAEVGPVRTTVVTYINPAVAVVAGALVLGEPITAWTLVGFALVIAGSYLVSRRGGRTVASTTAARRR